VTTRICVNSLRVSAEPDPRGTGLDEPHSLTQSDPNGELHSFFASARGRRRRAVLPLCSAAAAAVSRGQPAALAHCAALSLTCSLTLRRSPRCASLPLLLCCRSVPSAGPTTGTPVAPRPHPEPQPAGLLVSPAAHTHARAAICSAPSPFLDFIFSVLFLLPPSPSSPAPFPLPLPAPDDSIIGCE